MEPELLHRLPQCFNEEKVFGNQQIAYASKNALGSGSFLAEISVRSNRKILIFIVLKISFLIKVSKNVLFSFEALALA